MSNDPLARLAKAVRKAEAEAKRAPKKILRPSQMRTENGGASARRVGAVLDAIARARASDPLERCDRCEKPRASTRYREYWRAKLCDACYEDEGDALIRHVCNPNG